jgi:outer membrane protein OmpA-like peptidoglycan-associated protein
MKIYIFYLRKMARISILLITIFTLCSCGATTQIVLLPDADGRVGKLEVSNPEGKQTQQIDQAWQSVKTSPLTGAPGAPKVLDEEKVKSMFEEALAAQPPKPVTYILNFSSGRAAPTDESLKQIPALLETIKTRASKNIVVVGHTDAIGLDWYNEKLSLKRASGVADILVEKGVDRESIEVTSFGKKYPLVKRPDGVAEPRNRRVEITVR